jgi:hypothetical protein
MPGDKAKALPFNSQIIKEIYEEWNIPKKTDDTF